MIFHRLFAEQALLPDGWARNVLFEVDADGFVSAVTADSPGQSPGEGAERVAGPVVPGMANLHSHAFQRVMAGLAEQAAHPDDSFWTWRELMYRFVGRLDPPQIEAIATQLYVELLKAGYTAVGEFHYLHHAPDGAAYADRAETGKRLLAAARTAGLGITLLPVLYGYGGFGGQPLGEGQRRFRNDPEGILEIVARLQAAASGDPQVRIGLAPHSLRAVTPGSLSEALEGVNALDPAAPLHIHVAEQTKEVEECLAWCGRRPVAWLLGEVAVDSRWCLVHATHMESSETGALARSGAVAGLCPTTEANLGDGLFDGPRFWTAGGAWGIGSDSHVSQSPIEELRLLEYGQRLRDRRRNVLRGTAPGVGAELFRGALAGGAQALGRPLGRLAPGSRADLLVLDPETPALIGLEGDPLLDALVFAGNVNPVRDVAVGGRWVVRQGRHTAEAQALRGFAEARRALLA
ncbi:formimidoylglutamate deiminase [Algihabitans albus]|uniref:formimidoylglutamate deiminase n=1 Tax=Algihabitans albus TaxID=2164067 RepID=UPI000E5D7F22|nr:formimidoylglutamate deiminase [Algihabitans albus]